jgi:hypothetical protein
MLRVFSGPVRLTALFRTRGFAALRTNMAARLPPVERRVRSVDLQYRSRLLSKRPKLALLP